MEKTELWYVEKNLSLNVSLSVGFMYGGSSSFFSEISED